MPDDQVAYTTEMEKHLIGHWHDMKTKKILDGKTKRNSFAYDLIPQNMTTKFVYLREPDAKKVKKSLINKMKYMRSKFFEAKQRNTSGAGRDTILKICPQYFDLLPILNDSHLATLVAVMDAALDQRDEQSKFSKYTWSYK